MKQKCSFILKSSIALILTVLMLLGSIGTVLAATVDLTGTGAGTNWNANIFFRVPDSWDLSTYPNVQAWAVQSTSASSGTKYGFLLGNMSVAGTTSNSRLYHAWVSANHSSWGNTEYIAFTANTSNWSTGDFYISTCGQYTKPLSYGATNSSGSYLFSPSNASSNTATNNNTMSGSYNGTNRDVLKKAQDFYVYTNGSSSATGGSVKVDAYYVNGSSYSGSSAIATSNITVDSNDTGAHEQYSGAVEGTKVTLTATPATGYELQGYYDAATGGNAVTSPYYVFGTKSVYARFVSKQYTITYKDQGDSTFSGTHASGYPTKHTYGTATTLKTATKSGYDFGGWYTTSACTGSAVTSLGATAYTSNITLYAKWTAQNTPLTAPTIKYNNATTTPVSMSAAKGSKARITWTADSKAKEYEVYKGSSKVATVTTAYYDIERGYSYGGAYTVKAVPTDTTNYSTSNASNTITFTFNKVKMTAPSASASSTDIKSGASTTVTISNFSTLNTSYISGSYATLKRCTRAYQATAGSGTAAGTLSAATDTLSPTSSIQYFYYLEPTTTGSEYYSQSDNSAYLNIYVAEAPSKRIAGDLAGKDWDYDSGITMTQYQGSGVYYWTSSSQSAGDHYFKFYDSSSNGYSGNNDTNNDTTVTIGESHKYTLTRNGSKSFKVSGSGVFVVYYDTVNNQIWVTQNTWQITAEAYTQKYNLATGSYDSSTASTDGGTVDKASQSINKNENVTVKATAKTGYSFVGWYNKKDNSQKSTSETYNFQATENLDLYALFKQNEPTKVNIDVANVEHATITAKWNNQTKTNGQSLTGVPVGASVTVTVVPATGYYVTENTPSLTSGKFTVTASTTSISATVAKNATIKAVTNKSSRGTVSVNKTSAHQDESVTITVTPLAGTLKSLTANYANGAVWTYDLTQKTWSQKTAPTSGTSSAPASTGANKFDVAAIGADIALIASGAAQTINMTLAYNSDVTINATFDSYSAESRYYYNGYDTSGNALSGYHDKQMTEGVISGEKFSYYHVENRSGADQLFTVSLGHGGTSNGKVYFTRPGSGDWNQSNVYAYFWKDGGSEASAWPGNSMSWRWNNEYGQGVYSVDIPTGVDRVIFNDHGSHQTVAIDLTTTNGAYYWDGTKTGNDYNVGTWSTGQDDQGLKNVGNEYFYSNTIYLDNFYSGGFNNHNVTNVNDFVKPKGGNGVNWDANAQKDYYIVVLYPNTTYTIDYNGHTTTNTVGNEPMVIWMTDLPTDDETVTVYAKDGSIRAETFGATYANIADTKIYLNNTVVGTDHSGNITNQTYQTYKAAKGDTLVIKTTIGATDSSTLSNAADLKAKYYVRGFCVNGEVSQLLDPSEDGVYTLTYKIPEDFEGKYIEITPIYYLKDTEANPIVTYRVTGFTDELKAVGTGKPGWGDTLYTYPFYGKLGGQNNAFGAYPGQPMVYYKGQYQMQIPQKSTAWDPYQATAATVNNTNVAGVTMSNGYWDSVHKLTQGYGDNSTSADHVQTYDYGDFYKIFNEKKPVDNIVFDFKYRTKKHNFENQPGTTISRTDLDNNYGTNGNGFELLTNFHGKHVDLFGTPLSGAAADPAQTTPVYVVSIGGVNGSAGVENVAGYYATEWMVYGSSNGSSYSRISAGGKNSIPPEVLVLNDDNDTSFNTSTYPSAVDTTAKPYKITDWKALYTALEEYRGKPVYISYEAADAQQGQEMYYTGTGGATRNDGRWLYSKNGENITSNIKIQYSNDNGVSYTDLNTTTPQVTGLFAYFTNTEASEQMTYATTIDPDKTFDFEAKTTNADYKFVGWYMADGTKITSDNASHTERSGSYTFVAKFMQVQSGQLILSHSVDTNSTYKGAGDVTIAVDVIDPDNGDTIVKSFPATASDITLDNKIIKSDNNYKIKVTLTSTPQNNNALGTTVLAQPDGQNKFFSGASDYTTNTDESTKTRTDTFTFTVKDLFNNTTQNVKSIIYHSYFLQYVFNYNINFEYYDRFDTVNGNTHTGTKKVYNVKGTLTNAEAAEYVYKKNVTVDNETESHRFLKKEFVQTIAPYESNFNEKLTWDFNRELDFGNEASGNNYVYTVPGHYVAIQEDIDTRTAIFALPYEHNDNGAATGGDVVTEATTTNLVLNNLKYETVIKAENGDYITAPSQVGDKYFQYWSINTTKTENETQTKGNEVARCYFKSFNFMAYDNYYIEPVYKTEKYDYKQSGSFTNITYLDTTRNQWNTDGEDHYTVNGDKKTVTATDRAAAADLLYNDFMLNYNFKGLDIYKNGDDVSAITDLGYIVERVQLLDEKQDGTRDTTMSKYADKGMTAAQAKDIATSYDTYKGTQNNITKYTGSDSRIARYSVDKTVLDNKNRIEIYDAYYNAAGWDKNDKDFVVNYAYKNYVYKVYTYMVVNGETIVSDNPAYFTMYNEALKTADKMIAN